jgi:hypothetical protein
MSYDLILPEDANWRENCVVHIKRLENQSVYQAAFKPGQSIFQVEVEPGDYKIENLDCGPSKKWDLDSFGAEKIVSIQKKVNYLGSFSFRVQVQGSLNQLDIGRGDREKTLKVLRQLSSRKPASWKERVVSAYNGKAIPPKYLSDEKSYQRGSHSRVTGEKVSLKRMNFDECEKNEFKTNPVPLGILSYQVKYENNRWLESKVMQSAHTFSQAYLECLENVLKEFEPGYQGHLEYLIHF